MSGSSQDWAGIKMTNVSDAVEDTDAANFGQLKQRIPTGVILLWSGSVASIPTGWVLCNGQNNTPDLRNRFVVGAGDTYAVAATGGAATVTLDTTMIPAHTHVQNAHTHTQNAHNHGTTTDGGTTVANGAGNAFATVTASGATGNVAVANGTAVNQDATAVNQNTGGGLAHENRPPYYALAYIMKT